MKLGGVIYLHSIMDKRMICTSRGNLDMFRRLCGDNALGRIVLGTTHWERLKVNVGKIREQQVVETWKNMIELGLGSKSLRFDRTKESASAFLDAILDQLELGEYETFDDISSGFSLRTQNVQYDKMMKNLPVMILYSFLSIFILTLTDALY